MFRLLIPCLLLLGSCSESRVSYYALEMNANVLTDSLTDSQIAPYRDSLHVLMSEVLAQADTPIVRGRPDSPLGSLIADVVLEEARLQVAEGSPIPEFCLLNIGGLRIDLPEGDIRMNHVFELMPFENGITLVELTPQGMQQMVDHLIAVGGQPVAGIRIEEQDSATVITVNGNPLEARPYLVATSDYLADGGDKMTFFRSSQGRTDLQLKIRDAIIRNFARSRAEARTITAPTDRRIILKQ